MASPFARIDLIAQCGEDIALAVDADRRNKMAIDRAGWLNARLSRWYPQENGNMGTYKKPKRPKRWIAILIGIGIAIFLAVKIF